MPRPGLGREVGIGDLAAHYAHQIAVPVGQSTLGLDRVLDPAHPDNRQADRPTHRVGDKQGVAGRDAHRGLDHEQRRGGHADRGVDVVDLAGSLHHLGHLDRLVQRAPALDQLVAADPHAKRAVGPDRLAHRVDDFQEDTGPGRQRAAVRIGALVRRGRQKPPHDGGMRALQLHAVEAAFGAVPSDCAVAGHDLGDLVPLHGLGNLAEHRVRHRAGRPHGPPGEHRRGLPAVVVELCEDRHAVRVCRRGHLLVAGDDRTVEAVDQLLIGPVGGMSRVLLGDDQADAARRAGRVVIGVLLGGKAVLGVVGQMRGKHDPVADHHRPDPQRREQVPIPAAPAHRLPPVRVRADSSGS